MFKYRIKMIAFYICYTIGYAILGCIRFAAGMMKYYSAYELIKGTDRFTSAVRLIATAFPAVILITDLVLLFSGYYRQVFRHKWIYVTSVVLTALSLAASAVTAFTGKTDITLEIELCFSCFFSTAVFSVFYVKVSDVFQRKLSLKALEKVGEETDLAKIVAGKPDAVVCRAALDRITDERLLGYVAFKCPSREICEESVRRITGESILEDLAVDAYYPDVRRAAAGKIANNELLEKLSANDRDVTVREAAAKAVTDEETSVRIAMSSPDREVRAAVIPNIKNTAVLEGFLTGSSDSLVRMAAAGCIQDEKILMQTAKNDPVWTVRLAAVSRICDRGVLSDIAENDENKYVRAEALKRIPDFTFRVTREEAGKKYNLDTELLCGVFGHRYDFSVKDSGADSGTVKFLPWNHAGPELLCADNFACIYCGNKVNCLPAVSNACQTAV